MQLIEEYGKDKQWQGWHAARADLSGEPTEEDLAAARAEEERLRAANRKLTEIRRLLIGKE